MRSAEVSIQVSYFGEICLEAVCRLFPALYGVSPTQRSRLFVFLMHSLVHRQHANMRFAVIFLAMKSFVSALLANENCSLGGRGVLLI